ncbi:MULTISPECIES: prolipoprotein diacylglyceryl transferase family protein [Saccharothrix]|uniref:prolipoprotein diacylglyceryl transferase family protein n=1 Tax=Saccharothrix TaxID=2071 RepID=UPI000938E3EF|nr:prolipoprotein diacylglyceryl transferase family protein [Saccharothrix sp. CB00851]OKI31964.1 hypothetical protein A6A25_26300 [Saccharothrix sp. CB00851]
MTVTAPAPVITVVGRRVHLFPALGLTGYVAGVGLGVGLAHHLELSTGVVLLLAVIAAGTFAAVTIVTRIVLGRDVLVYYHQELAVLGTCWSALHLTGHAPAPYLDVVTTGIGTVLAVGRVGCYAAGCCHGRPARFGVRYTGDHVEDGFPARLLDVPLIPVQLLEALVAAALVATGIWLTTTDAPAGTTLLVYHAGYAVARFLLEPLRDHAGHRRPAGLTHTQWTALAVLTTCVIAIR